MSRDRRDTQRHPGGSADARVRQPGPVAPQPSVGRRPLNRESIVEAALDLAHQEGLAAVSMRRLSRVLGVEAMSLYYYIPSKAALMLLMADRSVSSLPDPDPRLPWDERLVELFVAVYGAGVQNPALFPVLASESSEPDKLAALGDGEPSASLALIEKVQALLAETRLPPAARWSAYRGLVGLLVGLLVAKVDGLLNGLPASQQPQKKGVGRPRPESESTATVAPPTDPVEDLRFSLRLFIDGLKAYSGPFGTGASSSP